MKNKIVKNLTKALTFCLCCVFVFIPLSVHAESNEPASNDVLNLSGTDWYVRCSALSVDDASFSFICSGKVYAYSDGSSFVNFCGITLNSRGVSFYDSYGVVRKLILPGEYFRLTFWEDQNIYYTDLETYLSDNGGQIKQFYIHYFGNLLDADFVDGMTLADWANSDLDTFGYALVSGYDLFNEQYVHAEYLASDLISTNSCSTVYRGLESKGAFEPSNTVITEGDTFFDSIGLELYNECYGTGYNDGYDNGFGRGEYLGFQSGYDEGYLLGKTAGESSAIGENLIGSGFSSITDSLNHIILYQSSSGAVVTLWVVICGAIGIALFIWVLKLFAGG